MCFGAAWLRGLDPWVRRVVPTGGRKPTPGPLPQQPMLHANQMLSLCHRTPPGQGEEMVLWYLGWVVGYMLRHLFLNKTLRPFFLGGGFCGVNSPSKLSSWKFQVQLPNFSMILPAGVIRDDFVFLGHGSCVNQPLGRAGGVKPEVSPYRHSFLMDQGWYCQHGHELAAHFPPQIRAVMNYRIECRCLSSCAPHGLHLQFLSNIFPFLHPPNAVNPHVRKLGQATT